MRTHYKLVGCSARADSSYMRLVLQSNPDIRIIENQLRLLKSTLNSLHHAIPYLFNRYNGESV